MLFPRRFIYRIGQYSRGIAFLALVVFLVMFAVSCSNRPEDHARLYRSTPFHTTHEKGGIPLVEIAFEIAPYPLDNAPSPFGLTAAGPGSYRIEIPQSDSLPLLITNPVTETASSPTGFTGTTVFNHFLPGSPASRWLTAFTATEYKENFASPDNSADFVSTLGNFAAAVPDDPITINRKAERFDITTADGRVTLVAGQRAHFTARRHDITTTTLTTNSAKLWGKLAYQPDTASLAAFNSDLEHLTGTTGTFALYSRVSVQVIEVKPGSVSQIGSIAVGDTVTPLVKTPTASKKIAYQRLTDLGNGSFQISFLKDDQFLFTLPASAFTAGTDARGYTQLLRPDGTAPAMPTAIDPRIVAIHRALLAASSYFRDIATEAGVLPQWRENGKPITVSIATEDHATTPSAYWRHQLRVPLAATRAESGQRAAQEFFLMAMAAISSSHDQSAFFTRLRVRNHAPFNRLSLGMFSTWFAEQSEIAVSRSAPAESFPLPPLDLPLPQWQNHEAKYFATFLANQLTTPTGVSPGAALLHFAKRFMSADDASFTAFTELAGEMVAGQEHLQETQGSGWARLLTDFAVYSTSRANRGLPLPSDSTDDAPNDISPVRTLTSESSKLPSHVYQEPAANDSERLHRLTELLVEIPLPAQATHLSRIALWQDRETAAPRPVFFTTDQIDQHNHFLLHRSQSGSGEISAVQISQPDEPNLVTPTTVTVNSQIQQQDLVLGMVNSTSEQTPQVARFAYLASPRLLSHPLANDLSSTVRLVGGTAQDRQLLREGISDGDTFTLEIHSSGPLHGSKANSDRLSSQDVSVTLDIVGPSGSHVLLTDADNTDSISIRYLHPASIDTPYYAYQLSGRISPDNTVHGACRFVIRLTSPLNLGANDHEIDDSLVISLVPASPRLEALKVSAPTPKGTPATLYDSTNSLAQPHPITDNDIRLFVEAAFSSPMETAKTILAAGFSPPYTRFLAADLTCQETTSTCKGTITIPPSEIPGQGVLLRFAISGEDTAGRGIDHDATREGTQADTHHSLVINATDYYLLKILHDTNQVMDTGQDLVQAELGPVELNLILTAESAFDNQANNYVAHFEDMLEQLRLTTQTIEDTVTKLTDQLADWRKNPAESATRLLAAKRQLLADTEKKQAEAKANGALRTLPQKAVALEKSITALTESIHRQETDIDFTKNILLFKEQQLRQQQARQTFLNTEVLPLFTGTARLMAQLKKYQYSDEQTSLAGISFGGARWQSINDFDPDSGTNGPSARTMNLRSLTATAQGFQTDDLTHSGMRSAFLDHGHPGPELLVWDIDLTDFERCRRLLALSGRYPADIVTPIEPGIYLDNQGGEEDLIRHIDQDLGQMQKNIDNILLTMARKMWEFFPYNNRPSYSHLMLPDGSINHSDNIFPQITTTRLLRLANLDRVVGNIPLIGHGAITTIEHQQNKDTVCRAASETRKTVEDMFARREIVTHNYASGQYIEDGEQKCSQIGSITRQDISFKTAFDWAGIVAPPELIDPASYDFLPARRRYSALWNAADNLSWHLAARSSPQQFEADPKYNQIIREIYIHSDAEKVTGELDGRFQGPAPGRQQAFHYRWRTAWQLAHFVASQH